MFAGMLPVRPLKGASPWDKDVVLKVEIVAERDRYVLLLSCFNS